MRLGILIQMEKVQHSSKNINPIPQYHKIKTKRRDRYIDGFVRKRNVHPIKLTSDGIHVTISPITPSLFCVTSTSSMHTYAVCQMIRKQRYNRYNRPTSHRTPSYSGYKQ